MTHYTSHYYYWDFFPILPEESQVQIGFLNAFSNDNFPWLYKFFNCASVVCECQMCGLWNILWLHHGFHGPLLFILTQPHQKGIYNFPFKIFKETNCYCFKCHASGFASYNPIYHRSCYCWYFVSLFLCNF